jgi:hypothetical protein
MRIAVLLTLPALLLAACGSSSQDEPPARQTATATATQAAATGGSADEQAIRAALAGYAAAVRAGDTQKVCARYMARELIKRIEALGGDCKSFTADRVKDGGPQYRLEVSSVEVTGDRAMVRARSYESDGARPGDTPMVREGGRWLMTIPPQP